MCYVKLTVLGSFLCCDVVVHLHHAVKGRRQAQCCCVYVGHHMALLPCLTACLPLTQPAFCPYLTKLPSPPPSGLCVPQVWHQRGCPGGAQGPQRALLLRQPDRCRLPVCAGVQQPLRLLRCGQEGLSCCQECAAPGAAASRSREVLSGGCCCLGWARLGRLHDLAHSQCCRLRSSGLRCGDRAVERASRCDPANSTAAQVSMIRAAQMRTSGRSQASAPLYKYSSCG